VLEKKAIGVLNLGKDQSKNEGGGEKRWKSL